jgi:hypothetical protein
MNRSLIIPAKKTLPWALLFTYTLSLLLPTERRQEIAYSGLVVEKASSGWKVVHGLLINMPQVYRSGGPPFRDLFFGVAANAFFLFGSSCFLVAAGRRRILLFCGELQRLSRSRMLHAVDVPCLGYRLARLSCLVRGA